MAIRGMSDPQRRGRLARPMEHDAQPHQRDQQQLVKKSAETMVRSPHTDGERGYLTSFSAYRELSAAERYTTVDFTSLTMRGRQAEERRL